MSRTTADEIEDVDAGPVQLEGAWHEFNPRPDQPERYDQQTSFVTDRLPGVAFLIGGNGAGTTECCCAKLADFVLYQQDPPRKDTPFWIIAESYEQVCEAIWKEKLYGHGHIPDSEIDWERVRWYKPKDNWPFAVPLKPKPGRPGKNWSLQFKSYKQGRAQMQARSIGGFMFSEQFPMEILREVLRGCREYNFRGAKMCEFTPIDPALSMELEDMIDNDRLPKGWQIYRANTECAKEAGHISAEWFEEFFGLIPEDMRLVRMIGAFASFEGAIYPQYNPAIHVLPPDWEPEPGFHHRRALDWGFGPDNAFCCLWGCKDNVGRWYIYDEYYSTNQAYTIHDHLKAIADRWPWPRPNLWYGCTYADPSEPGNLRIAERFSEYHPKYHDFDIQGASNSVLEGIEHVKWLLQYQESLKSPRLMIVKENCPNLSRQMRTYRWERGAENGRNPRDALMKPLKKDDHACFISGSMVDTPSGPVPIEQLRRGDIVHSHLGEARVDIGAENLGEKEIIRVTFSDGRSLMCTAEHPLALSGGGWVAAAESLGQKIDARCRSQNIERGPGTAFSLLSTADTSGADTRTRRITRSAVTSDEANEPAAGHSGISGCTSKSTKTPTVRSRTGSSCTTRTTIPTTTIQRTSNSRHLRHTQNTIAPTSIRRFGRRGLGTELMPAGNGTGNTDGRFSRNGLPSPKNAITAEGSSRPKTGRRRPDTAPTSAGAMRDIPAATTTSSVPAPSVATNSPSTATLRRKLARQNVQPLCVVRVERSIGQADVFNLATADGTYFVNGILVSNCDALRYLVYTEANKAGIIPEVKRRERNHQRYGVLLDKRRK